MFLASKVHAIDLDVTSSTSICDGAALIADGVLDYYDGTRYGGTVGMFQSPYYWWEAGEAMGSLLGYWFFCKNDTFNTIIYDALMAQRGSSNDYIPSNQSMTEGNDDQGFWGLAVMEATERNFTNPPSDQPGWLALSQAVFNTMWARWDDQYCGGGLRWQIFTWNSGYTYKNTISTACMFTMATRLGRYTGNETYFEVADTAYQWLVDVGFVVVSDGSASVYDGAQISSNCSDITQIEWSYNMGLLMAGCAYAYNATSESKWLDRTEYFVAGASIFFTNDIMYERACQGSTSGCNNDQRSFKSIFSRCLGQTAVLAPSTYDTIYPWIVASAEGAALSCTAGSDGHTCGQDWTIGKSDYKYGLGEQMSALEIFDNLLINQRPAPYTNTSGGTSTGDPSAGLDSTSNSLAETTLNITSGDKAGAGVITAIILAIVTGGSIWMVV
jgi:mannan endo-1,6-alpha-mannosidase